MKMSVTKYVRTDDFMVYNKRRFYFRFHDVTNVTKSREKVTHVTCEFNPYTNKVA